MINLLNGLCQGIVLAAMVWVALRLIPRVNAATRYAVWCVTLLAVMVLPIRPLLVRSFHQPSIHVQAKPSAAPAPINRNVPFIKGDIPIYLVSQAEGDVRLGLLPVQVPRGPVSLGVVVSWIALSIALFIRLVRSFRFLQGLKCRSTAASHELQSRVNYLACTVGVTRRARLLVSDEVAAPMALGLFDPVILVPGSLPQQLSDAEFDQVALHELSHLRRYDDWMNLLQKLIEAAFPIQPAVFWIGRQMALERESACDDWVIALTGTPKPYAAALTRVAELTLWAPSRMLANGAAGNPSQLYRRVQRLLSRGRNITPRVSAMSLLLGVFAVMLLVSACARAPKVVAFAEPASAPASGPLPESKEGDLPRASGTETRSFAVRAKERLRVDVDRGEVNVTTWDKNEVQIIVKRSGRDIDEFVQHHRITITQDGGGVRVRAKADRSLPSSAQKVRIEYQITVPREFDAEAAVALGTVSIGELKGEVDASASMGTVRLNKIDGPARAQSSQGVVEVVECTGKLRAETSSGNVDVRKFTGPSLHASTSLGNVTVEMASAPAGDCSLNSSSGNVSLTLPQAAAVNIDAATSMGNVSSDLPLNNSRGMMGGTVRGPVNGGGPNLKLATSMGNIQIRQR